MGDLGTKKLPVKYGIRSRIFTYWTQALVMYRKLGMDALTSNKVCSFIHPLCFRNSANQKTLKKRSVVVESRA